MAEVDESYSRRLVRGRIDRFWRAERRGDRVTLTEGDVKDPAVAETRTYRDSKAAMKIVDELVEIGNRGFLSISEKDLDALLQKHASASGKKTARQKVDRVRTAPEATASPPAPAVRPAAKRGRPPARSGPYAKTWTSPAIHFISMEPRTKATPPKAPRATSGGRPIMAEGQSWPVCGSCDKQLALYLQFDIDDRFGLAFPAGSHFLLFNCPDCLAVPIAPPNGRLPAEWVDPEYRSTHRIILNAPKVREVVHEPDPRVLEQIVTFIPDKESIAKGLDGPVGAEKVKVGGIPTWTQPPYYVTCSCGAPMGFVMQVPFGQSAGWKKRRSGTLPFGLTSSAFLFACTVGSSPYATVMILQ